MTAVLYKDFVVEQAPGAGSLDNLKRARAFKTSVTNF